MRKKAYIIANCIWAAIVLFTGVFQCGAGYRNTTEYTVDTHLARTDSFLYATDNTDGRGHLYCIDTTGNVVRIVEAQTAGADSKFVGLSVRQNVYVLTEENAGETASPVYQIAEYSEGLELLSSSRPIQLEDDSRLTGFSVDEGFYYLTIVDADRTSAVVYRVRRDEGAAGEEAADGEAEPVQAEKILLSAAGNGRTILQARYQNGRLLFYLDDGSGAENFAPDETQRQLFNARQLTVKQYLGMHTELIFRYVVILLAGFLLLAGVENILKKKNRLTYLIFTLELVLFLVAAGTVGFAFCLEYRGNLARCRELSEVYLKSLAGEDVFLAGVLPEEEQYYNGDTYYRQLERMKELVYGDGTSDYFQDICMVRLSDGKVMAGTGEWNGRDISSLYTQKAQSLYARAANEQRYCTQEVRIGNRHYHLGCTVIGRGNGGSYALVGILSTDFDINDWREVLLRDCLIGLAAYGVVSLLCVLFLTAQSRDVGKLKEAMLSVAEGSRDIERPAVHGADMESMWNSINETDKAIRKMSYSRLQIFEAYYRFAPKDIEKLLQKKSILEVACGDERKLAGSLAIVSTDYAGDDVLEGRNHFIQMIERRQTEQGGVVVSNDTRLSVIKILFPGKEGDTVQFGVDLIRDLYDQQGTCRIPASVFLFQSEFTYGVAGTETQCFTYLDTGEQFGQNAYAGWLRGLGLRVVVTEAVMREGCRGKDVRYLGYVNGRGVREKLYEVLDACPARERRAKLQTRDKFEQALQLFYQYDFYLARSTFSEVLRELPEDRISKWYLFACEKHLNETHGAEIDCSLHYE